MMTYEDFNKRDLLLHNFKKIYKNLKPMSFIPNKQGTQIKVIDKDGSFHDTEVYVKNGIHHISFPFENAVGFLYREEEL